MILTQITPRGIATLLSQLKQVGAAQNPKNIVMNKAAMNLR